MNRSICFFSVLFLFTANICIEAQPQPASTDVMPGFRRQALTLDISARVLEKDEVIWDESHPKTTIPGSPVGIRLVGSNIVVAVQFTPFIRRHGSVMVAQGQIWIDDHERGISYYTSIQTIPMEFNEPIYFFPLGESSQLNSSIEIKITVSPYLEPSVTENEEQ
jgi:hypothetical protein